MAADRLSAYADGLRMLARRELSVEGLRARLLDRDHPPDTVETAIRQLLDSGALDDARVARAYARTAATVKGRGRLRVMRELAAIGIAKEIAAAAIAEVFGDLDERSLIARALQKKLRHTAQATKPGSRLAPQEYARLYQYLMRQGFSPAAVTEALRKLGRE